MWFLVCFPHRSERCGRTRHASTREFPVHLREVWPGESIVINGLGRQKIVPSAESRAAKMFPTPQKTYSRKCGRFDRRRVGEQDRESARSGMCYGLLHSRIASHPHQPDHLPHSRNPTPGILVLKSKLLPTTLTLLNAIASAAHAGSRRTCDPLPVLIGYNTPAATGRAIIL